jgi:hypothetical protein
LNMLPANKVLKRYRDVDGVLRSAATENPIHIF